MKYVIPFILIIGIAVAYNVWLNSGCDMSGVMTWEGKVCF